MSNRYAEADTLFAEADTHRAKVTQATEAYCAASAFTTSKRAETALAAKAFVKAMNVEAAEAKAAEICAEKAGEAAAEIADANTKPPHSPGA